MTWVATLAFASITVAATSPSQTNPKAAVYTAVINGGQWNLPPLSRLVVKTAAIPMPSLARSSPDWLTQWTEVPETLRRAAERPQPTLSVPLSAALFPAGTRLVAESAIQATFASAGGAEDRWPTFNREFAAAGWVGFSDIVLTADRSDALVYYEGRCGNLCGIGAYVWLHRATPPSGWILRKMIVSWMS